MNRPATPTTARSAITPVGHPSALLALQAIAEHVGVDNVDLLLEGGAERTAYEVTDAIDALVGDARLAIREESGDAA